MSLCCTVVAAAMLEVYCVAAVQCLHVMRASKMLFVDYYTSRDIACATKLSI